MTSQSPLGKFVNTFIGRTATSLDHIENSPFIRGEAGNFAGNFTAESGALAEFLMADLREKKRVKQSEKNERKTTANIKFVCWGWVMGTLMDGCRRSMTEARDGGC